MTDPTFAVPRVTAFAIRRTRLLRKIDAAEARGARIVLASAMAGAGKTTLLAQHAAAASRSGRPVGWVSVGNEHDDRRALWRAVVQSLAGAIAPVAPDAAAGLARLAVTSPAQGLPSQFTAALAAVGSPVWLILDDVQLVSSRRSLDLLEVLLRDRPEELRVVMGARYDPPLKLARIALDGAFQDLRFSDLAFDRAETLAMLEYHDVDLSEPDLDLLLERTEGWPAALRLAAISMSHSPDAAKFVTGFAGADRPVADYLSSEIMSALQDDVVDFLLVTAVPDRLTAELASVLSGRSDAGAVLGGLEQANLLVHEPGTEGGWYRYHSLLRSYLLAELTRREALAEQRLHAEAAHWFDASDLPGPALDQAIAARDWPQVADLIAHRGLRLLASDGAKSLRRAIDALPSDAGSAPAVQWVALLAALGDGDLPTAHGLIARLGRAADHHAVPRIQVMRATALLHEARLRGDGDAPFDELIEATRDDAVDDPDLALLAALNRGVALLWLGRDADAEVELTSALRTARRGSRHRVVVECLAYLSGSATVRCDFVEMDRWARKAIRRATALGWASSPVLAFPYAAVAFAAWQVFDPDLPGRFSVYAETTLGGDIDPAVEVAVRCLPAVLAAADPHARRSAVTTLRAGWERWEGKIIPPAFLAIDCLLEITLALRYGETAWATEVAGRAERRLHGWGDLHVCRALVHANHGRDAAAHRELVSVLAGDVACHSVTSQVLAWLLEAHLADVAGESVRAHAAIQRVLDLAAPRRMMRDLVHWSTRVCDLLVRNRGRFGEHEEFVTEALARGRVSQAHGGTAALLAGEALTTRELALLRDLPSLLSLDEIAAAHVVSPNTVKTHLKSVYRKLDVASRRAAVDRARELGLL
ncbi:MAG TPA: LuxR C-terminal-related transcriptional regulator [Jiangellaceae bacterium]|nr:LuxR C-terminal-related transcriptional regulator [Jiangellaceae bacterium]